MKPIYEHLKNYTKYGPYPFHMPGHKRNPQFLSFDSDPVAIDVTEVPGTDNLQSPSGIIHEAQVTAARLFGADESFLLANGSTGGVIAAILSAVCDGGRLIMARNSHMSAYSAVTFGGLCPTYVYPKVSISQIPGSVSPEDITDAFTLAPDAQAVFITSPTYEGVVSDIAAIADIAHKHNAVLIVDEAHGSHFKFHDAFPASALKLGADIVVHSLHKTLPSLTQTAILHTKGSQCNLRRIRQFLNMVNSSSPSYILLSSIGQCLEFLKDSTAAFDAYAKILGDTRYALANELNNLLLIDQKHIDGAFDYDVSKLVLVVDDGNCLKDSLYNKYSLQLETASDTLALAMTSVADTRQAFERLKTALSELDKFHKRVDKKTYSEYPKAMTVMPIKKAIYSNTQKMALSKALGYISAENITPYPPGLPICLPGELISAEVLEFLPKNYLLKEVNVVMD